jgi:hypothetical protein
MSSGCGQISGSETVVAPGISSLLEAPVIPSTAIPIMPPSRMFPRNQLVGAHAISSTVLWVAKTFVADSPGKQRSHEDKQDQDQKDDQQVPRAEKIHG